MKIAVIGNCQAGPLGRLLGEFSSDAEATPLPAVHTIAEDERERAVSRLEDADIIVSQPIGASYGPIATARLRQRFSRKTWIMFPSIFFAGLCPNLMYLRLPQGGTLRGPLQDYHDRRIIEAFLEGRSEGECVEHLRVANRDPASVEAHLSQLLADDAERERNNGVDVPIADFIHDNWRRTRLFFTFNHPSNDILIEVALRVLDIAGARVDSAAAIGKARSMRAFLGNIVAPVEPCLAPLVQFPIETEYQYDRKLIPVPAMVEAFYAQYAAMPDLKVTYEYASARVGRRP